MKPNNEALEQLIDRYCAAWNEPDAGRREQLIAEVWSDGGTYLDPTAQTAGRAALSAHIGKVQERYPGGRVTRTTVVDAHHNMLRFGWRMELPDGKSLPDSIDIAELASDGKIGRIVGFFGPLADRQ